jgi:hypothetical protein
VFSLAPFIASPGCMFSLVMYSLRMFIRECDGAASNGVAGIVDVGSEFGRAEGS